MKVVMMKIKVSLIKLVDIVFIFLFIFFVAYLVIDLNNIYYTLKETEKSKIKAELESKKRILAPLLKFSFYDFLKQEIISLVNSSKEIKQIEIISKDFKFKYPMTLKTYNNKIVFPLKYKNQDLGKIIVFYADKDLLRNFFNKYLYKFVIYLVIFMVMVFIILFYIREKIKKLNLFAKKIKKINFRRLSSIKPVDNYYEIVNITNAINKLLEKVHSFYVKEKKLIRKLINYKNKILSAQQIAEMVSWEFSCEDKKFFVEENIEKFLKIPGIKSMEDFIECLDKKDKKVFLENLEYACKECKGFELTQKIIGKDTKTYYVKTECKCFLGNNLIGISLNITEEVKKQEEIEFLAYHDPLTSLPNRMYLKNYLATYSKLAKRNKEKFAILYLDLDNFKMINDTLGHESGDRLLIEISRRVKSVLRQSDLVARIGGDEFIIVLYNIKSKEDVKKVVEKIQNVLNKEFNIKNSSFKVTFSIGIAVFPDDSESIEELFQYADIAMYESKKRGKNSFTFINEELKKEIKNYYEIVNDLERALEKEDELILYFQPKIDIINKKVIGCEGLIRWLHPKKGLLTPFYFISYAEKSGLIAKIDRYVVKKAFETLERWGKNPILKDLKLAINISANEFKRADFVDNLKNMLKIYDIDVSKLELEITETLSVQNFSYTIKVLEEVKSLGIRIALDDFGTGYSSLNYLKELPFDTLKIDQTFVRDLDKQPDDVLITKMIIEISKILKKENVAEGVENKKLLKIVKDLGCQCVQGYYFSKPISEDEFLEYVKNFKFEENL
jgi:diguanylate cyclase (GGDEF)-like protein